MKPRWKAGAMLKVKFYVGPIRVFQPDVDGTLRMPQDDQCNMLFRKVSEYFRDRFDSLCSHTHNSPAKNTGGYTAA